MLSFVALIGVSHAVNLSDAVAESERWERIRHVAVEAIPRINAGGLVAKRALLGVHCHRFGARCGGSEFTLGDDSSDVLEMVVCVLILQILSTVGVLDVAATLMKRPSSSETIRGDMFACF